MSSCKNKLELNTRPSIRNIERAPLSRTLCIQHTYTHTPDYLIHRFIILKLLSSYTQASQL